MILGSYFLTASGISWLLTSQNLLSSKKSAAFESHQTDIKDDVKLSVLSAVCFALGAACFMAMYDAGLTRVYLKWGVDDLGYIALSYVLVLILQDTCFYFSHRLLHHPLLFRYFHEGHHYSRPPTPWTFFALEPVEAISQISFLLGLTLVIPLNLGVLVAVLVTMTVWSTGNHMGLQVVPMTRSSSWWGQWFIGSSHHLIHHQRYSRHYGLYFTFWDKVLGTQDEKYEAEQRSSLPAKE